MNGISLFSSIGIGETYLEEEEIYIKVANEIIKKRAEVYNHFYPNVKMINDDITKKETMEELIKLYKENDCEFLIATPPCQGLSKAGKRDKNNPRNRLILPVIDFIKETQPKNIIIENVPRFLKMELLIDNELINIMDYIKKQLEPLNYHINPLILNTKDYGTPQSRKRAIVLISNIKKWEEPKKQKEITLRDAIGDLPSLESEEDSGIKYHKAQKHVDRHILWMKHTPTGETAFNNEKYYPQKEDGTRIKGYNTTYKRIEWDKPAPTVTMCNGAVSSQNNVHPGRELDDGTYSDARVLTLLELLRVSGLPDDWNIPDNVSENFIRNMIGEQLSPKLVQALIKTMPKESED